jgi:nitroreductase
MEREKMIIKNWERKIVILSILCIFLIPTSLPALKSQGSTLPDKELPPPLDVDMILETSICRRMSIREFTMEPVSDEMLSTILWAAFGVRNDKTYTISEINRTHAAVIYVLNEEAAYTYDPDKHSLFVYKQGDHRSDINILQYEAPIQIGLCWDTSKADANQGGAELGQIGQNIQFMANALGLGTVVTGQTPPAIKPLGLPTNQEGLIIMPLGHPKNPYNFKEKPMWISPLPGIKESSVSLSQALENHKEGNIFQGELSKQEISQLLWSSYGYSQFIDASKQEPIHLRRHRTVPSAHGYYPLIIYAVTEEGIYQYYPNILTDILVNFLGIINAPVDYFGLPIVTFIKQTLNQDVRSDIAQYSNQIEIASAPLLIIPVLDLEMAKELSIESARRFWYYEAGAVAHNVLLEATAWDLSAKIIYPVDSTNLCSVLELPEDNIPMLIIPIGE